MSQSLQRPAGLSEAAKRPFVVDEVNRLKIREYPTDEAADLAEIFLRRLEKEGINAPRLRRRDGRTLVVDYLPGTALTAAPSREMIVSVARLQARLHHLDWPEHRDRAACIENYRRYFMIYLDTYVQLGLLRELEHKRLAKHFEALAPWQMHPALIHDDLWGGNVLLHEGDLFLIDYASVKFLALESDVLNASRYFHTALERIFYSPYSLRTFYLRAYAEHGRKMQEVVDGLSSNRTFFLAFNSLRKGANMLWRRHGTEAARIRGLEFAMRQLRRTRRLLGT